MNKFEWRGFIPTPGEKYLGIAEVKIHGDVPIVLRFKIVGKKDGSGFFLACASYKMPGRMPGEEYDECFMLDSRADAESIRKFIMQHYNEWQGKQTSVFNSNEQSRPVAQQNPNYAGKPQQSSVPFIERPEYQPTFFEQTPPF